MLARKCTNNLVAIKLNGRSYQFSLFEKLRGSKKKQILEVNLSPSGLQIVDDDQKKPIEMLKPSNKLSISRLVYALQSAVHDEKIAGVSFILGVPLQISDVQEIRSIIQEFKKKGKFTSVYSENYTANFNYYLASVFERIFILPSGLVFIKNYEHQVHLHWGDSLKKIGANVSFITVC